MVIFTHYACYLVTAYPCRRAPYEFEAYKVFCELGIIQTISSMTTDWTVNLHDIQPAYNNNNNNK